MHIHHSIISEIFEIHLEYYVQMWIIYVNMQHNYADMQHN